MFPESAQKHVSKPGVHCGNMGGTPKMVGGAFGFHFKVPGVPSKEDREAEATRQLNSLTPHSRGSPQMESFKPPSKQHPRLKPNKILVFGSKPVFNTKFCRIPPQKLVGFDFWSRFGVKPNLGVKNWPNQSPTVGTKKKNRSRPPNSKLPLSLFLWPSGRAVPTGIKLMASVS